MKKVRAFSGFLAAALTAASLTFAGVANAAPDSEKTYRVKINKVDSEGAQLEGAKFNIVKGESADGEVVDSFESNGDAYFAELAEGTYTLVETEAPAGYDIASPQTFTVDKPARWTDSTIGDTYKAATDYVWFKGYYKYTVKKNVTTGESVSEVVYCVNSNKSSPAYNTDYIKLDGSGDVLAEAVSTTRPQDGDALREKLMSVIYNGYPTNASGIQGSLSDDDFRSITQTAVWDTVDYGGPRHNGFLGKKKEAYNKLMEYTQNVPEDLEAHMYKVKSDQAHKYQSLMGTVFAEKAAPMEITVVNEKTTKTDVVFSKTGVDGTEELPGASLEIRDEQGETIEQWISEETPHVFALTPGTYSMHESQAPLGYDVATDITFRVTEDFQVQIKEGEEWVDCENATVHMEDYLTPVPYGSESPTPSEETEKPNLPNTGTDKNKNVLANTGAQLGLSLVFMMVALGSGLVLRRKSNI